MSISIINIPFKLIPCDQHEWNEYEFRKKYIEAYYYRVFPTQISMYHRGLGKKHRGLGNSKML